MLFCLNSWLLFLILTSICVDWAAKTWIKSLVFRLFFYFLLLFGLFVKETTDLNGINLKDFLQIVGVVRPNLTDCVHNFLDLRSEGKSYELVNFAIKRIFKEQRSHQIR